MKRPVSDEKARAPVGHTGPLVSCLRLLFISLLLTVSAPAGEILAGRLYTVPEKVYVSQAFEIHFELEVSFGSEIEDVRISDFPNNPDLITVGRLESTSRTRVTRDNQSIDVLHFIAAARCHKAIAHTFAPAIQCTLVERRNTGFFSHWQSYPKQKELAPFALRVLPLPEAGRPANFSGAIGTFRLLGRLVPNSVQPGDITTLSLTLTGQGWLGEAPMPAPADSPLFKSYPVKELVREPLRVQTEQIFIPQSTNAVQIAAARFSFFNPSTDRYEESVAGPFNLIFSAASETSRTNEVRVIDTARPAAAETLPQAVTIARVNETLRHAVPLLVGCAGALVAFFVFFLLYGAHKRIAFVTGLALLIASIAGGYAMSGKTDVVTRTLVQRTDVRFAPSGSAATLFSLHSGSAVTPLESAGSWIRVDSAGRRGWIHAEALQAASPHD